MIIDTTTCNNTDDSSIISSSSSSSSYSFLEIILAFFFVELVLILLFFCISHLSDIFFYNSYHHNHHDLNLSFYMTEELEFLRKFGHVDNDDVKDRNERIDHILVCKIIPLNELKEEKNYMKDAICSICFEDFYDEQNRYYISYALPCSHEYHHSCIHEWLKKNDTCPYCRTNFFLGRTDCHTPSEREGDLVQQQEYESQQNTINDSDDLGSIEMRMALQFCFMFI